MSDLLLHPRIPVHSNVAQITVATQLEQWQETPVKLGSPDEDTMAEEETDTPDQIFLTSQEIRHMNERVQQWLYSAPSPDGSTDEGVAAEEGGRHWMDARNGSSEETLVTSATHIASRERTV